jgi:hypothetical protein
MIKTEKKSVTLLGILLRLLGLVTISIDIILFIVRPVCLIYNPDYPTCLPYLFPY